MKRLFIDEWGLTVFGIFLITIAITLGLFGLFSWEIASLGRYTCETTLAKRTGLQTDYDFPSGCFVRVSDKWIPADRWIENTGN